MEPLERLVGRGCGIRGMLTDVSVLAVRALPAMSDAEGAVLMRKLGILQKAGARPSLTAAQTEAILARLHHLCETHIRPMLSVAQAVVTGGALHGRFTKIVSMHRNWLDEKLCRDMLGEPLTPWADRTSALLAGEADPDTKRMVFDRAVCDLGRVVRRHDAVHGGGSAAMSRFAALYDRAPAVKAAAAAEIADRNAGAAAYESNVAAPERAERAKTFTDRFKEGFAIGGEPAKVLLQFVPGGKAVVQGLEAVGLGKPKRARKAK